MTKLFTKSRFKIALDCPTKLFYASNDKIYGNANLDDPFLRALAKGGFQVGALAQCYYPEGIEIKHKVYENSLRETYELLKKENVTIFEAAIRFDNLFVRVDILEKKGNHINLIEVKSKSADPSEFEDELWVKRELKNGIKKLKSDWQPYIYDVAFQAHVIKLAFPDWKISSFLMCADKSKTASVDGLNQKFLLRGEGRDTHVVLVGDTTPEDLGREILCRLDVSVVVNIIHSELEMSERFDGRGFSKGIEYFAEKFQKNEKIEPNISKACKKCEFRIIEEDKKSGFNECWKQCSGLNDEELKRPFAFDVWKFNAEDALCDGNFLIDELDMTYFNITKTDTGLSIGERQWLQVEKFQNNDQTSYLDIEGLKVEFSSFIYPLHMIDFETCMAPIPFNKGRRPYEQIAFQFSHHIIYENGKVEHADEYINSNNAASAVSIDYINGVGGIVFNSTYDAYCIEFIRLVGSGAQLWLRTTTNASTFDATSGHYRFLLGRGDSSAAITDAGTATAIRLTYDNISGATTSVNGQLFLYAPATAQPAQMIWHLANGDGSQPLPSIGQGYRNTAADIDGFQILNSAGTAFTSGTVNLYGRVKA